MRRSRLILIFMVATLILLLRIPAEAFWGFGSGSDVDGSGLDLAHGYDRNTVVTITGRVLVPPKSPSGEGPVSLEMEQQNSRLVVVLGPRWYLQDDNLDWKAGEAITVRGSKAQGKDGRSYLLTEWVKSPSGGQIILRNDSGRPGWSGGLRGAQQQGGAAGQLQRGAGGGRRGR